MPDDILGTVKAALAKVQPCPKCNNDGVVAVYSSHAEHDPGCDGSCRNCPVEVPDIEQGPCDCQFAQASITEADYQQMCGWLRALVAEVEAARIETAHLREAFITMERAANEREQENAALRQRIAEVHDEMCENGHTDHAECDSRCACVGQGKSRMEMLDHENEALRERHAAADQ